MEKNKSFFLSAAYIRVIFAVLLGVLLLVWPESALTYLVSIMGVLFLFAGLFTLFVYFSRKKGERGGPAVIPAGMGSALLGIWLMYDPAFFVNILMIVLGILLLAAGLQQLISLILVGKRSPVPVVFYLFPSLVLIAGIVVLINPFATAAGALMLFGIAILFYGVTGLINLVKFRKRDTFADIEIK